MVRSCHLPDENKAPAHPDSEMPLCPEIGKKRLPL
jgi:hypothetical protein